MRTRPRPLISKSMTRQEILNLPMDRLKVYLPELAEEYREKTGRKICLTCWGDINFLISTLKREAMSAKFELKSAFAIYKLEKGSAETISNGNITDELAIRYLKINPERISLFSRYPDDWDKKVSGEDCCDEHTDEPCADCMRESLEKETLPSLKAQYQGDVQFNFGQKKADYIDAIIAFKLGA